MIGTSNRQSHLQRAAVRWNAVMMKFVNSSVSFQPKLRSN